MQYSQATNMAIKTEVWEKTVTLLLLLLCQRQRLMSPGVTCWWRELVHWKKWFKIIFQKSFGVLLPNLKKMHRKVHHAEWPSREKAHRQVSDPHWPSLNLEITTSPQSRQIISPWVTGSQPEIIIKHKKKKYSECIHRYPVYILAKICIINGEQ